MILLFAPRPHPYLLIGDTTMSILFINSKNTVYPCTF